MDAYIMARHQLQKPLIRYDCTVCYDADLTDATGISAAQMRQDFIKLRMQERFAAEQAKARYPVDPCENRSNRPSARAQANGADFRNTA